MRRNETRREENDLTGNRVEKSVITDTNHDGTFSAATDRDSVTQYTQDANDRMLSESTVVDGSATESNIYGYTGTQQTSKTVTDNTTSSVTSALNYTYDLQGRMSRAVTVAGNRTSDVSYLYGTDGIRISAREDVTENGSTSTRITSYLIDAQNHTGYQQVLQETVTDGAGNLIQKIVYTIGHDHISQSTWRAGDVSPPSVAVFHFDGHGNTRILTDLAGSIVTLAGLLQVYHYDAYGNALNFTMTAAATQYLYSGEQFDPRIGQQYLRARYYDSATGTFNRLDPFFGNQTDPQSFHKYLYTHGDPVNGVDPTGMFFNAVSGLVTTSVRTVMARPRVSASLVALDRGTMLADGLTIISTLVVGGAIPIPLLAGFIVSLIPGAGLARLGGISWKAMGRLSRIGRFAFSNGDNVASFLSHGGTGKIDDISDWMTGVYSKLSTAAGDKAVEFGGELGATVAAQKLGLELIDDFPHRYHGIDGLYKHGDDLVIVEAKGFSVGTSPGLGTTQAGEQLSQDWIEAKIVRLEALADAEPGLYAKHAADLRAAITSGKIKVLLVETEVDKGANAITEVAFELRNYDDIGATSFRN